jgi:hypothetical protein
MVLENTEQVETKFKGTIIDLESIGDFNYDFPRWKPEHYLGIRPTIFGYLTNDMLVQYCAESESEIPVIVDEMKKTIPKLEEPFYALNTHFESCVILNTCSLEPPFRDVRHYKLSGGKWDIRKFLGFPTYGDPFNGIGYRCLLEWKKGNYYDCLKHNRACLLIERDIYEYTRKSR